jgi:hypothetical protein
MKLFSIAIALTLSLFSNSQTKRIDSIPQKNDSIQVYENKKQISQADKPIRVSLENNNDKNWNDYLSAILAPLVALLAIWIAYRQYKTQRYQVRLDLFERRMKIIEDVRMILTDIDKHYSGDGEKNNLELFRAAYRHSKYLFSSDIQQYLKTIDNRVGELEGIELKLKATTINPTDENNLKKSKEEAIVWLRSQRVDHESRFAEFMTLNKI